MVAIRLAWRMQRWEIIFVAFVCLGLAAAAMWQVAEMRSAIRDENTSADTAMLIVRMAMGIVAFVVGLVLGVPLVAREIEHRTALLAWPLASSRLRWLVWRAAPVLGIGLLLLAVPAIASDQMTQAYLITSDPGFDAYDSRGVPMLVRSPVVLVLGMALGALIGRLLPALLIGIALSVGLAIGLESVREHWVASRELAGSESSASGVGAMITDLRYRMPDGTFIGSDEAEELRLVEEGEAQPAALPEYVYYGVSADRYWEVVIRESVALAVGMVAIGGFAALVVNRRRPE